MFKNSSIIILTLMLISSSLAFSADFDFKKAATAFISDDKVQSFVAGAVTQSIGFELISCFKHQPYRAASLSSLITLSHAMNIWRKDEGKAKRFFATLAGVLTSAFIKNDQTWFSK